MVAKMKNAINGTNEVGCDSIDSEIEKPLRAARNF